MEFQLTSNMENYLEKIYELKDRNGVARMKDIAEGLNVKMPSVTEAVQKLSKKGLINYEKYGYVELTEAGGRIGEEIRRRHNTLALFLRDVLGIDEETAQEDACGMEHIVSAETLDKMLKLVKLLRECAQCPKQVLQVG
ncbi:MAG: metal-dependent transcriptional regulator [bacterium]